MKAGASTYRSGPTMLWRKIKCYETGELEIIGIDRERGKVPPAASEIFAEHPEPRRVDHSS